MNPLLHGLAANPALAPDLLDRLLALALSPAHTEDTKHAEEDDRTWLCSTLADREDLGRDRVLALAAHDEAVAVSLAYRGLLDPADVDPAARPGAAVALLEEGRGLPRWPGLLVAHPDPFHRERLACCPGLPPEIAARLAGDARLEVVTHLAGYGALDPATAALLAAHPHAEVRRACAGNPSTPPPLLGALLTGEGLPPADLCAVCDTEPELRWHNRYVPPDGVCEGSHRSAVHTTRWAALDNPATPAEAVVRFARDPASPLRRVAAARVDLPQAVYAELAADPDPRVRIALAGNPGVGEALLGAFAADADPEVHAALAHQPRLPLPLLAALAPALRTPAEPLPRIAAASEAEVRELAASTEPGVRVLVAQRRDLPVGVREAPAADPDVKVVKTVASHPGLGEDLLRDLVARHGVPVLALAAANPDVTPALLEDLALWDPPVRGVLRTVATHPRATARALIACLGDAKARRRAVAHPSFPAEELPGLLRHPDWQVAEAAASHPALPPSLMRELLGELMHESMHESTGELLGERPAAPMDDPPTGG